MPAFANRYAACSRGFPLQSSAATRVAVSPRDSSIKGHRVPVHGGEVLSAVSAIELDSR